MKKLTKTQVKSLLKKGQTFVGYLVGNKVHPYHINNGWNLGYYVEIGNLRDLTMETNNFEYYLDPELGTYTHFYKLEEGEQ